MGRQKTIPIRRFEAEDEQGRKYSIVGSQKMIDAGDSGGSGGGETGEWSPGDLSLRTVDGLAVKYLAKGVYEVLTPAPIRVASTDPRAP